MLNWAEFISGIDDEPSRFTEGPLAGYSTPAGTMLRMDKLVRLNDGSVQPSSYGESIGGRPLWAFYIGNGKKIVLITSMMHSLEFISAECLIAIAEEVDADPPEGIRFIFIPIVNPDGAWKAAGEYSSRLCSWHRGNLNKVDLNRNFPCGFNKRAILNIIGTWYKTGPSPLSEPESRALVRLAEAEPPAASLELHSMGGYVFYPWCHRRTRPEAHEQLMTIARRMAAAAKNKNYRYGQVGRWSPCFKAYGTFMDHLLAKYGTLAFLVEVSRQYPGCIPLKLLANPLAWFNPLGNEIDKHVEDVKDMSRILISLISNTR